MKNSRIARIFEVTVTAVVAILFGPLFEQSPVTQ